MHPSASQLADHYKWQIGRFFFGYKFNSSGQTDCNQEPFLCTSLKVDPLHLESLCKSWTFYILFQCRLAISENCEVFSVQCILYNCTMMSKSSFFKNAFSHGVSTFGWPQWWRFEMICSLQCRTKRFSECGSHRNCAASLGGKKVWMGERIHTLAPKSCSLLCARRTHFRCTWVMRQCFIGLNWLCKTAARRNKKSPTMIPPINTGLQSSVETLNHTSIKAFWLIGERTKKLYSCAVFMSGLCSNESA